MPSEIKFNNFGIPYLVDFANISIRSKKDKAAKSKTLPSRNDKFVKPKAPPPLVRCPTCGHVPSHAHEEPPKPAKAPSPGGLYIRFATRTDAPTQKISSRRLERLRSAIEDAVTNAGMIKPSPDETGAEAEMALDSMDTKRSRDSSNKKDLSKKALFKGTYGQVKQALKDAGLVTTPCSENGFENATRLGALLVVNGKATDGLELTKLTLWG